MGNKLSEDTIAKMCFYAWGTWGGGGVTTIEEWTVFPRESSEQKYPKRGFTGGPQGHPNHGLYADFQDLHTLNADSLTTFKFTRDVNHINKHSGASPYT